MLNGHPKNKKRKHAYSIISRVTPSPLPSCSVNLYRQDTFGNGGSEAVDPFSIGLCYIARKLHLKKDKWEVLFIYSLAFRSASEPLSSGSLVYGVVLPSRGGSKQMGKDFLALDHSIVVLFFHSSSLRGKYRY